MDKITTNHVEEILLKMEIKEIEKDLEKIGSDLINIFSKYGKLSGKFGKELQVFLSEKIVTANEPYFAGFTTAPRINSSLVEIPRIFKQAILSFAVKNFMDKIENMSEVIESLEQ